MQLQFPQIQTNISLNNDVTWKCDNCQNVNSNKLLFV